MDVRGAGDYMPKVDTKIQRIKEQFRSNKGGLARNLPPNLVKDLVAYAVSRINSIRSASINQSVAPKVLYSLQARSVPCIFLYRCNNALGSWAFLNLATKQRICRLQWIKMVTTNMIITRINSHTAGLRWKNVLVSLWERRYHHTNTSVYFVGILYEHCRPINLCPLA